MLYMRVCVCDECEYDDAHIVLVHDPRYSTQYVLYCIVCREIKHLATPPSDP